MDQSTKLPGPSVFPLNLSHLGRNALNKEQVTLPTLQKNESLGYFIETQGNLQTLTKEDIQPKNTLRSTIIETL